MEPGQGEKPLRSPKQVEIEATPRSPKPSFRKRLKSAARRIRYVMDPAGPKVDTFDTRKTAMLISIGMSRGNKFDVADVLAQGNRFGGLTGERYYEENPDQFRQANHALLELVDAGILETRETERPGPSGERVLYRVVDKTRLKEFLKGSR